MGCPRILFFCLIDHGHFFQILDNKWGYLLKIRVVLSAHFFISGRCAGMMGSGGMCTTFNVFLSDHFVIVSVLLNRVASGGQLIAYFLSNALRLSLFIGFFKRIEIHLLEKDVMDISHLGDIPWSIVY